MVIYFASRRLDRTGAKPVALIRERTKTGWRWSAEVYAYKKIPLDITGALTVQINSGTYVNGIYIQLFYCCLYINITPKIGKSQGYGVKIRCTLQFFRIADIIFSFESLEITK